MSRIQASGPAFAGFRQLPGGGFPFTMVPNQFLDEIVPIEKPCVVKVVCLVLRRTLGWVDQTGQRRQQNQVAYSEFAREMNMSTQAVADGLKIALEKGYIVRVKAGTMRDATSGNPEAASYSLRWLSPLKQASMPTPSYDNATDNKAISENSTAPGVRKEEIRKDDSENQTVLSSLKNRDMINKADSEKTNKVELKPNSKFSESKKRRKFSSYIGNLVSDIGEQFGDGEHRLSNIKQALNCWEKSQLAEKDFAQLLYQARHLTRQHANAVIPLIPTEKLSSAQAFSSWVTLAGEPAKAEVSRPENSGPVSLRNRMPYFFKVLQDLIQHPAAEPAPVKPLPDLAVASCSLASETLTGLHNKNKPFLPKPEGQSSTLPEPSLAPSLSLAVATAEKEESLSLEVTPVEIPSELIRLAASFAGESNSVLATWQGWEASLEPPRLKALARRAIFLEKPQVRPELRSFLFSPASPLHQEPYKEILLVFRNSFDTRYATSIIDDIALSIERLLQTSIKLTITHG
jgi:hypothetical protein